MTSKLISACWIVFLAYWLISAHATKRTIEQQRFADAMLYQIPQLLGALLLFLPIPLSEWNALVIAHTPVVEAIAVGLCVAGLLGAIWSRRTLAELV